MLVIGGFVAQQVSVRTAFKISAVAFFAFFAYRKRYSAIGKITLYRTDNITYHIITVIRIFSALKYKRSEAKLIACFTAIKYLLLAEPVALCLLVTAPYSAIITVVFTVVGKFYQTSDINVLAVIFFTDTARQLKEIITHCVPVFDKRYIFAFFKVVCAVQL